jgi:hypothetical protein
MKVTARRLYPIALSLLLPFSVNAQCGTCTYTETSLGGSSPIATIPAGTSLCITTNTCVGSASAYPGTCANAGPGSLTINGTLRICDGVTLAYAGTITGTGNIEILSGGRFSLYGTFDCRVHITAVDPSLLSGTSTSSLIGSCNSSACEPHFSDGYAPFGVVATGLGYTVANGSCTITGTEEYYVLPLQLTSWTTFWQDSSILLSWSTSNNDGQYQYGIDYSKDGENWLTLTKTIPGAGASGVHDYSYLASGPFAAHNFFRLHWQDAAGRDTYSPVKELDAGQPGQDAFFAGPNPVRSTLMVRVSTGSAYTLQVLDVTGTTRLLLPANTSGSYNVNSLSPGTYLLVVLFHDGTRWTKKLTKL